MSARTLAGSFHAHRLAALHESAARRRLDRARDDFSARKTAENFVELMQAMAWAEEWGIVGRKGRGRDLRLTAALIALSAVCSALAGYVIVGALA